MRAALVLAFVMALAADGRTAPLPWSHVRPTSPAAHHLLALASARSAVVRAELEQLEHSDVVVLLVVSVEPVPESMPNYMTFLTEAAGARLVTIRIYQRAVPTLTLVPALGHELQHALELAAATGVREAKDFDRLFASIGWAVGERRFETALARETEGRVRQELGNHSRPAAPAVAFRHP